MGCSRFGASGAEGVGAAVIGGLHAYKQSKEISKSDPDFYALIFAAIRKADDFNLRRLESVFPDAVAEFRERYNAPGGRIGKEVQDES